MQICVLSRMEAVIKGKSTTLTLKSLKNCAGACTTPQVITVAVSLVSIRMKMDIVIAKISMNVILIMEAVLINVSIMKVDTCASVPIGEISVSAMMVKHANLYVREISFISAASAGISRAKQTIGMPKLVVKPSTLSLLMSMTKMN